MCFERTPAVILVFLSLLSATVDGMMYVGVILLFLCTNCTSTYKLYVYTTYKYMVQGNLLDSIAVSLFTSSETAAATPLRVMRNFQLTLNLGRYSQTDCFLID